jgi:hypothetical protein
MKQTTISTALAMTGIVCAGVLGGACSSDESSAAPGVDAGSPDVTPVADAGAPDTTPVTDTGAPDVASDALTPDGGRALIGANPALTPDIQIESGYWYSRYEMSTLAMASGMGDMVNMTDPNDPFAPMVMAAMPKMIDMANDCPAAATNCTPPIDPVTAQYMPMVSGQVMADLHPTVITRIYNSGDPSLANAFDTSHPIDTLNMRFVPSSQATQKTTTAAYGWLAVKEVEWARQFHVDEHFGAPGPSDTLPLAQTRLFGEMIFAEAMIQTKVLLDDIVDMSTNPPTMKTPTKFDWSDPRGNYVVVLALADLAGTLIGNPAQGNVLCTGETHCSVSNRYRAMGNMMAPMILGAGKTADDLAGTFLMAANMLLGSATMFPTTPPDVRAGAVTVISMTWLASAATNTAQIADAKTRLRTAADYVLAAPKANSIEQAASLRALIEAYRLLGDAKYQAGATSAWTALLSKYDPPHGRWTDVTTYTADDFAYLYGALNSFGVWNATLLNVSQADQDKAANTELDAFESIIDKGGFQLAAPPARAPFIPAAEYKGLDLYHRYPTMPTPPAVTPSTQGNGVAPMCAHSITWGPNGWTVDRSFVDVAQCMHMANEFLWAHSDEVNGFPTPGAGYL